METLIIGAGPTGIAAALTLLQYGIKPTIITKAKEHQRSTGLRIESVSPDVSESLSLLGIDNAVSLASVGIYTSYNVLGSPKRVDIKSNGPGHHISRIDFDKQIVNLALSKGINIIETEKINRIEHTKKGSEVFLSEGRRFESHFIIDASGRSRFAAKYFKQKEILYSPPFTTWSGITEIKDEAEYRKYSTSLIQTDIGWNWTAPLSNGDCAWTRFAPTKQCDLLPPKHFEHLNLVSGIFSANVTWRLFKKVAWKGVITAGEAAGVLDPATGHGIYKALNSGIFAAKILQEIYKNPSLETELLELYNLKFKESYEHDARLLSSHYKNMGLFF